MKLRYRRLLNVFVIWLASWIVAGCIAEVVFKDFHQPVAPWKNAADHFLESTGLWYLAFPIMLIGLITLMAGPILMIAIYFGGDQTDERQTRPPQG